MQLTEEIKTAARQLGQALRHDDYVRAYLDALKESQTDPDASALEKNMYDVYEALIARQQTGELLDQEDARAFYELRRRVQAHPLISKRDDLLRLIQPNLAQVAEEIGFVLGVDYTALARPIET
jgi:cell fate (sporulation/competence/biofilm development) regulator YlbF (YheA/YmcA/DUF963 family)